MAFGLAVRHEVIPRNPMDRVARLHKPKRTRIRVRARRASRVLQTLMTARIALTSVPVIA